MKFVIWSVLFLSGSGPAHAEPFQGALQSTKECVAGKRVTVKNAGAGTMVRPDRWSPELSYIVKIDGADQAHAFTYWDISIAGGTPAADAKPVQSLAPTERISRPKNA